MVKSVPLTPENQAWLDKHDEINFVKFVNKLVRFYRKPEIFIVYNLNGEMDSVFEAEFDAENEKIKLNKDPHEEEEYFVRKMILRRVK